MMRFYVVTTIIAATLAVPALGQSMTAAEKRAEAAWKLRAALNVAALQCQYNPSLKAVDNYNSFVKLHKNELDAARSTMESNYRRRFGKGWAGAFDRYNTKNYNSWSATDIQVAFCTKMGDVGSKVLAMETGAVAAYAETAVPEIRALYPAPPPVVKAAAKPATKGKKKSSGKSKKKKKA
jgi:hypothetical protein